MSLFHTILLAADFSESSREAFRAACSLFGKDGAQLVVMHAIEPIVFAGEPGVPPPLMSQDESHRKALGEELRGAYKAAPVINVKYYLRDGLAAEVLLRTAEELGCDLVVMGTHGRSALGRLLMGSVAETVLRKADCPVLVLRSPARLDAATEAGGEAAPPPIRTILHPTDFSACSNAAFALACKLAENLKARLIVLHAAPMATVFGGTFPGVPNDPRIYQHALETRLRQIQIPGPAPGTEPTNAEVGPEESTLRVEHRLREGDAAAEIVQVADDMGADLIVIGTHGRTGLRRILTGSVAEAVLRTAHCPVLALKPTATVDTSADERPPAPKPSVTVF